MTSARKRLHISVDAGAFAYPLRTGIGRYLEAILPLIVEYGKDVAEFSLLAGRPFCNPLVERLKNEKHVHTWNVSMGSHYIWQQTVMGAWVWRHRPAVHFAPDGLLPVGFVSPSVGVVHDMIWRRFPQTAPWHIRAVFRARQARSLRRLTVALTDSEATRQDLIQDYGKIAGKVRVVPLGVDTNTFHPLRNEDIADERQFREHYRLSGDFVLSVGNLLPHKNLKAVAQALGELWKQGESVPDWVVIGHGDSASFLEELPDGFPVGKIRCLGFLKDEEIALAMRLARVFLYPSLYEGFGLPILEAMASGTPVIHSGRTSVAEVAGDAGLAFDPERQGSLAEKLKSLLKNEQLRDDLVARGLARVAMFGWERCAKTVWDALVEASGKRI